MSHSDPSSGVNSSISFAFFDFLSLLASIVCMYQRFSIPTLILPVKLDLFSLGLSGWSLNIPFFGEPLTLDSVSFTNAFSGGAFSFRSSKIFRKSSSKLSKTSIP